MLLSQQSILIQAISQSLSSLNFNILADNILLEASKNKQHGDVASNIAMKIASLAPVLNGKKANPRELAQNLVDNLKKNSSLEYLIEKYEVAGAGFINFFLSQEAKTQVIQQILYEKEKFGVVQKHTQNIILEFVSANPTGPLHVGHGRQAALGDCLSNLLKTQGFNVYKEFYYNDAGVQIETLTNSVYMRLLGHNPNSENWPQNAYNGDYIIDIANAFLKKQSVQVKDIGQVTASGDINNLTDIKNFSVAYLRQEQDEDLKAFRVEFDNYYLESSLYSQGKVQKVVDALVTKGKTYLHTDEQKGQALYLKTTEYGDDKDRVMRKSDGSYTYFVPDIAYHVTKFTRGFSLAINIQGFDHHGTIARVRAGLQALEINIPPSYPQYILHKMVTVMRNGKEVKISKRAGSYVTLRDLIEWSSSTNQDNIEAQSINLQKGRDAVRFFLISRKADTEFVFDVDIAIKQNDENPVYYIQYAHARISSILNQSTQNIILINTLLEQNNLNNVLSVLKIEPELALLNKLAWYPHVLKQAATDMSPHDIAFYLRQLSSLFHSFYANCKVLVEDTSIMQARLALLLATKQVIANGLNLLGVSAPQKM